MRKYLLILSLSFVCLQDVSAMHTKGGWLYYEYLGPGITDPSKLRYKIGINFYVKCNTTVPEEPWTFSIFDGADPYTWLQDVSVSPSPTITIAGCMLAICYPCLSSVPERCYWITTYETIVELAPNPNGYVISKQRCCRISGISNIPNSQDVGETFTVKIPGTSIIPTGYQNSSPKFIFNDTVVVCGDNPFTMSFRATDIDGDSLSYSFVSAYDGASPADPSQTPASPPPYGVIPYQAPYTGVQPLGSGVTINPVTGIISGIAPAPGEYVICVLVKEFRNGVYFAEARKELHLYVAFCNPLNADPNFTPVTCDGFTVNFTDNSSGNPTTHAWDFGDPASGSNNTSNLPNPTHTFTVAGNFNVKLVVSISGQCIDSITKPLGVFPGFFPGFSFLAPLCKGVAVQFQDTSKTNYGFVDSWLWDFGDPGSGTANTSTSQNPTHTYANAGSYTVTLTVTNSKGCQKFVTTPILINDVPLIAVFPKDSTYCGLDTLQLTGVGIGSFNWTPNYNIIGANTATPTVFPAVTTKYYSVLTAATGCKNTDSLTVYPKFDLANFIAGPTIICEEDTVTLTGTANHSTSITWQWGPPGTIESPNSDITRVYPIANTTYTLITRWGNHCVATKTHTINVNPLANPNAGPDSYVCPGNQNTVQLNASGGNSYSWTPTTGLSDPNIANPIASPLVPTTYTVAIGVSGCSKLRNDDVFVDVGVPPALAVMNDTLICIIDTLQITTAGTGNYTWSPNYMINSITSPAPLVSPDVPTWYYVRLTDAIGCHTDDSVFVDVKSRVTIDAGPDTSICATDRITLGPISDALHYNWSPATYLSSTTVKQPFATPLTSITYYCIGNIGNCENIDSVHIKVGPYPVAVAGPDPILCPGFSTQLQASGGTSYLWSPVTFLNNRNLPNPTCTKPFGNIQYVVTVSDTLGCPKATRDTVWVLLHAKPFVDAGPHDTIVVEGEPLYLNAIGNGGTYTWNPGLWLNNSSINNPVALPHGNINYEVLATTANGCLAKDTIRIKWYNVDPDIYVPTAWAPNGFNKELAPILRGMKQLNYFRVFNRFGEMVFQTTEEGKGWDGVYKGKAQDVATYVWYAEGITYRGQVRKKKGYAVLIR